MTYFRREVHVTQVSVYSRELSRFESFVTAFLFRIDNLAIP
jgi:hypothetical protein